MQLTLKLSSILHPFHKKIKGEAPGILPYFTLLYYIEIIYLIFVMLILYGKVFSVIAGTLLSLLLAWHIISLNYLKNRNRIFQLFIMDIHAAYSFSFLVNILLIDVPMNPQEMPLIAARVIMILGEIPMIFSMTAAGVASRYR